MRLIQNGWREVGGLRLPIISSDHQDLVPPLDPLFEPGAWRARTSFQIQGKTVTVEHRLEALAGALVAGQVIGLSGPPGCGKTTAVEWLAAQCGWPLVKVTCHRDLTCEDFVGGWRYDGERTVFEYGPLSLAMCIGAILLLDEQCRAPSECLNILQGVMEQGGTRPLTIAAHGGEVIHPHRNFRVVCADQSAGFGDVTGLHPDIRVQDAAFLSRIQVRFHVEYPDVEAERRILEAKTGLSRRDAARLVEIANITREAQQKDDVAYAITTRHLLSCGEAAQYMPLREAFAAAVLAALPPEDASYAAAVAQRVFDAGFIEGGGR